MRLFVALTPPSAVLDALAERVADVRALPEGSPDPAAAIRWSVREQWHISLAFLGEVDEPTLPELRRRLARVAARYAPIELCLDGAGGFGSLRRARVLWAGVRGETATLRKLAESVAAAARRCDIPVEQRRFRAHLTLGRLAEPADLTEVAARLAGPCGPPWVADRLELIRSHLGQGEGRRSRYETLDTWRLAARPRASG